ncbi:MAG TPA: DCC1-like thiol-disulfide oxidoreductase family protein [Candidatus Limnocylindrales bacterium]|nr:DCC1-like thiol-disulfide oxidoreductase family protein [Candidatus Limnocylindrales bacterium]
MNWKEAWTGGQYSAIRIAAAGTIAIAMAVSIFSGDEIDFVPAVLAATSLAVAAGIDVGGRTLAAILASAVAIYGGSLGSAASQFASLWLSAHVLMPRKPYGSLGALGRRDPGGGWKVPSWYPYFCVLLFVGARSLAAAHAVMDGHEILAGCFLFVAALFLFPTAALVAWLFSLGLGIALAVTGHGSFSAAWLLHLLTFQPAWIPPRRTGAPDTVFYDGTCALCHGAVRFVLAEDVGARLRISPLGSALFLSLVPAAERERLPDSVIVVRGRQIFARSAAAIEILDTLGGVWWVIALVMRMFPAGFRDATYDAIASRRYRWFGRRSEACPLMPPELRGRIEA